MGLWRSSSRWWTHKPFAPFFPVEELVAVATVLFVGASSAALLRGFPPVAGYVIGGLLLSLLGFHSSLVDVLAELGVLLLLFYAGLEVSWRRIASPTALFVSLVKSATGFGLAFLLGRLLGLDLMSSIVLGASASISSTAVALTRIKNFASREGSLLLSILILEDIYSVLFLSFLTSSSLSHPLLMLFLFLGIARYLSPYLRTFLAKSPVSSLSIYSLGLLIIFSYITSLLGLSPTLGAFFAGLLISESALSSRIGRELDGLRKLLSLIFFTSMGIVGRPLLTPRTFLLAIILTLSQLVASFVGSLASRLVGLGVLGSSRMFSLMLPLGEFSVYFPLLLKNPELVTASLLAVLFTSLLSSLTPPLSPYRAIKPIQLPSAPFKGLSPIFIIPLLFYAAAQLSLKFGKITFWAAALISIPLFSELFNKFDCTCGHPLERSLWRERVRRAAGIGVVVAGLLWLDPLLLGIGGGLLWAGRRK